MTDDYSSALARLDGLAAELRALGRRLDAAVKDLQESRWSSDRWVANVQARQFKLERVVDGILHILQLQANERGEVLEVKNP